VLEKREPRSRARAGENDRYKQDSRMVITFKPTIIKRSEAFVPAVSVG